MFASNNLGCMNFGFPDVCLVPTPVGPIPLPFPNISLDPMAMPVVFNVIYGGGLAENLLSTPVMSNGDNAGVNLGVASGLVMGPTRSVIGSFTCLTGGLPTKRLTSMNIQNSTNCPGMCMTPAQFKVLVLSP